MMKERWFTPSFCGWWMDLFLHYVVGVILVNLGNERGPSIACILFIHSGARDGVDGRCTWSFALSLFRPSHPRRVFCLGSCSRKGRGGGARYCQTLQTLTRQPFSEGKKETSRILMNVFLRSCYSGRLKLQPRLNITTGNGLNSHESLVK